MIDGSTDPLNFWLVVWTVGGLIASIAEYLSKRREARRELDRQAMRRHLNTVCNNALDNRTTVPVFYRSTSNPITDYATTSISTSTNAQNQDRQDRQGQGTYQIGRRYVPQQIGGGFPAYQPGGPGTDGPDHVQQPLPDIQREAGPAIRSGREDLQGHQCADGAVRGEVDEGAGGEESGIEI
jgi:hypothetical protein